MAKTRFEEYRKQFTRMHPHASSVEDGVVVLEASVWNAFQDPESKLALERKDVEALGITVYDTNAEIIKHLREVLSKKVLPEMNTWTRRYLRAKRSTEVVEDMEERRLKTAEAARAAIGEILKFCEEAEGYVPDRNENRPQTMLDKLIRLGRELLGKLE